MAEGISRKEIDPLPSKEVKVMAFVEVKDLTKIYRSGEVELRALDGVSLTLEQGKIYAIVGPSGSGKSTLFNIIGGIDRASSGKVVVDGEEVTAMNYEQLTRYRREKVGFLFQFYNLINTLTVYENVQAAAALSNRAGEIMEYLEMVGMADKKDKFPLELSGGEQQRVALARAVIKRPPLILCDEPTGALDYENAKRVLKLVEKVHRDYGPTIVMITHNLAIAEMAHYVVSLRSGQVVSVKANPSPVPAEEVTW